MKADLLREVLLDEGLVLRFFDESNRYFGDFHRICIRLEAEIAPVRLAGLPEAADLKTPLTYERTLERMGVPGNRVESAKQELMEDFLQTSSAYLLNPDFPRKLLRRILSEKRRPAYLPPR